MNQDWRYNLNFVKATSIYHRWILLKSQVEFNEIIQIYKDAVFDCVPDPPKEFPCMMWLYDAGPQEAGMFPNAIYVYFHDARQLIEASGFTAEATEERKKKLAAEGW